MGCPRIESCALFPLFRMKSSLGVWQAHYCDGAYQNCERFKMATRGIKAPKNLLPNGRTLDIPELHVG